MKGDFHVRFRENVGVKFPCVTRLPASLTDDSATMNDITEHKQVTGQMNPQTDVPKANLFYKV
jgi:hypothetical protein